MTAADMTHDEMLTAIAYLQAVWDDDVDAVAVLSDRADAERGILDLVIDLADRVGQLDLLARLGIHDGLDEEQRDAANARVDADPAAGVTAALIYTYRAWAKTAEGPAVRDLSMAVIGYLALMARVDDVSQIFEMMRASVLSDG
ncbi:hypothetical protein ABZX95_42305 [Streptomyces sp. NPDC004232]|uniref:hypothetical protein n=1 Tax=Streptomyces sp. NPDC004232 TaxID=3154454 RepID=UPI0033A071D0